MRILHDIPIKHKLTIITMMTSCSALLLACTAFVIHERYSFHDRLVEKLNATAGMVEEISAAALVSGDAQAARTVLRALGHDTAIVGVALYDRGGRVFARHHNRGADEMFVPPPVQHGGLEFTDTHAGLFRDVHLSGEIVGTIYLRHNMEDLRLMQQTYVLIAGVVLLSSLLASWLVCLRLQRVISEPVGSLAEVVARVSNCKDYSARAVKRSADELGQFIDGFNGMLDQIQARDHALQAAQDELEQRVEERTSELAQSLSVLNATLDSSADGIFSARFSGDAVSFNSRFALMWEIPDGVLERRDLMEIEEVVLSRVVDPEGFIRRIEEMFVTLEEEVFDVVELKDGRTFERCVKPQRIDGRSVGMVVNFRDVTARRRAETELEDAHRQLLEISRRAGMSEVATNVLHNVGNVLNSVNISCSVIADKVRKSRVASVARTAELLHRNADRLPAFVSSDPAGRKLPEYLGKLAQRLSDEQTSILGELRVLGRYIGHIKEIVAAQQNYAKSPGGITETLPLEELVEDALRMIGGSLARRGVTIVREYCKAPPACGEKHKVVQILVNLIRNAEHALVEGGREDRRLTLRIAAGDGHVALVVSDNGCGIAPEHLQRVFAHGFTTKRSGHGFGLHGSVLAAQEMGGRLTVESSGAGGGATFTLELPLATPAVV